ncbi:hypothetical protein [Parabacteroides johnsonii]|uniref:hypothetical protein n=1 Tax=Parabacteroides johnsonii TaxID=387661 RepID=UPI0021CB4449|nr:hypothetical protein [Parabacteroides johnsonii]
MHILHRKAGSIGICSSFVEIASLKELAATTLQHGLLGTRSYQGFSVWGNMTGNDLVQVITSAELDYYKNIRSILIPEQLKNLGEESNPIFIFYKLKDS